MIKKHLFITTLISVLLFTFVVFLIYIVYCFSFYDKNLTNKYINNFNNGSYDFVYNNMVNSKEIDKDSYNYSINLMFKKDSLEDIYNKYYRDSNKEEFFDNYYYGRNVLVDGFSFKEEGKTSFFKRKKISYDKITIFTNNRTMSSFGIKKDVKLLVEKDSSLIVDEKECKIIDNYCHFDYILGGLHTITYDNGNDTYFGLVNVIYSSSEIEITNLSSLIKIDGVKGAVLDNRISLGIGKYVANEGDSFVKLNNNSSFIIYKKYNLEHYYEVFYGTYDREGNTIVLNVDKSTYRNYLTNMYQEYDYSENDVFVFEIINEKMITNNQDIFVLNE